MFAWLKNIFTNPKVLLKVPIDALDLAVPMLAKAIDDIKEKPFNKMSSSEQAQFAIDWVQEHLRKLFKIDA